MKHVAFLLAVSVMVVVYQLQFTRKIIEPSPTQQEHQQYSHAQPGQYISPSHRNQAQSNPKGSEDSREVQQQRLLLPSDKTAFRASKAVRIWIEESPHEMTPPEPYKEKQPHAETKSPRSRGEIPTNKSKDLSSATARKDDSRKGKIRIITKPQRIEEHSTVSLTAQQQILPFDKNSTIASDIVKIWHDPNARAICVALKRDARCPHPALLGRLFGPGLAILEWKEMSHSDAGTVLCGSYDHYWLDSGDYFVEILVLFCKDFGVNALERTTNLTEWLEANHTLDCVEDATHNRITTGNQSTIHIPTATQGRDSYRRGRWVRRSRLRSRPLVTRYQPAECFNAHKKFEVGSPKQIYCSSFTERDSYGNRGLYEYEFQWPSNVSKQELVERLRQRLLAKDKKTLEPNEKKLPKICAVGDSHNRMMTKYTLPILNLVGLLNYVKAPWIEPDGIIRKIKKQRCDIFLLQIGQWPAAFMTAGKPFSFGKYHDLLKRTVQNLLEFNPKATVYLPTVDQAPLMGKINKCRDWRTPTMLDGYTHVQQMIVQELNTSRVKYLDTNFIIYTHWDGHPDWQHLLEIVRTPKTIYTASVMLGETEWFED